MSFSNLSVDIQNNLVKLFWSFTGSLSDYFGVILQISRVNSYGSPIWSQSLSLNENFAYPESIFVKNSKYYWRIVALGTNFTINFYDGPTFIYSGATAIDQCIPMWPNDHWSSGVWPLGMWPDCSSDETVDDSDEICSLILSTELISKGEELADLISMRSFSTNLFSSYSENSDLNNNILFESDLRNFSISANLSSVNTIIADLDSSGTITLNANGNLLNSVNISRDLSHSLTHDTNLQSIMTFRTDLGRRLLFDGEICDGC